ncbi:hypothetical protein DM52_2523 [Burkholderia mallei]|nr:hypothetical protein DM52_2523 [Burkholderia mallei]
MLLSLVREYRESGTACPLFRGNRANAIAENNRIGFRGTRYLNRFSLGSQYVRGIPGPHRLCRSAVPRAVTIVRHRPPAPVDNSRAARVWR